MATILTDQNFASEVLNSDQPYLVDFWAPWCGPCRMVGPLVDEIAEEYQGRLKVGKLNVDEAAQVAGQYGIMSIPTLAIFKGGARMASQVGARPKAQLAAWIEENI